MERLLDGAWKLHVLEDGSEDKPEREGGGDLHPEVRQHAVGPGLVLEDSALIEGPWKVRGHVSVTPFGVITFSVSGNQCG